MEPQIVLSIQYIRRRREVEEADDAFNNIIVEKSKRHQYYTEAQRSPQPVLERRSTGKPPDDGKPHDRARATAHFESLFVSRTAVARCVISPRGGEKGK